MSALLSLLRSAPSVFVCRNPANCFIEFNTENFQPLQLYIGSGNFNDHCVNIGIDPCFALSWSETC